MANANGKDWQEEVYQKIKSMKEIYLEELNTMYKILATRLRQEESLPPQQRSDEFVKVRPFMAGLENMIQFLSNIQPFFKDTVDTKENYIKGMIQTYKKINEKGESSGAKSKLSVS